MQIATWKALLTFGMLLPAASIAEDADLPDNSDEQSPVVTLSTEELLMQSGYASRWRLLYPTDATVYYDDWPKQIADLNFQDESALARASRLQSLSLLTLAEFGTSRLFLGINGDGLLGLHFNVLPRNGDERYLEVVRMPYLKENEPDTEMERRQPGSK